MYDGLVIADDLTGAIDTGYQFSKAGLQTVVSSVPREVEVAADILVVETGTRSTSAERARKTVAELTANHGAGTVYKKVDSTLRGNVAAEVAGALDSLGPGIALVAPAFPGNGRVTVGGYQLVDGEPITASGDYEGENAPSTSNIVELLSDIEYPVEHVAIDVIAGGETAVVDAIDSIPTGSDSAALVCDASTESHLATIANVGQRVDAAVYVGSAGLANQVAPLIGPSDASAVLGVVGSTNERTIEQLSGVPGERVVAIDCEAAVESPRRAGDAAAARVLDAIETHRVGVITSVNTSASIDEALAAGTALGLDRDDVEERVLRSLRIAAAACWEEIGPVDIFATGGAVASNVLSTLDVDSVELTGREIASGIPIAQLETADGTTTRLVTKAGGFGDSDAITRSLHYLRHT
ncbi:hypothetical protein BRC91_02020 [Halobacteriales archaeon QS_4_62_28]|nr:MAG: hypothetical protein BRC91_02020 [Halobacteriales archaeon QS_4_62_28]